MTVHKLIKVQEAKTDVNLAKRLEELKVVIDENHQRLDGLVEDLLSITGRIAELMGVLLNKMQAIENARR